MTRRLVAAVLWLRSLMLVSALALAACGGPPRAAHDVVRVSAVAVSVADGAFTSAYVAAAERLAAATDDLAEREAGMAPWRAVERALAHAQSAVVMLAAVLDAWRAGAATERDWLGAAACLVPALEAMLDALERHEIQAAPARSALALVRPFATGLCER